MNIVILVLSIFLYVAMIYFTLSVLSGMNYVIEGMVLLLCLFWPVTFAVSLCALVVIPLCRLGKHLGGVLDSLSRGATDNE